ncbi:prolyl oligopeptidase family serine peptidase [Lutibacter sp. A80]|uniref:carboxylesterase family protein n=1 Tax=Lutibacter sp. A80 TaxID=2918453 RepID=UPI001F06CA10|nr:prolyl oligopeptidase family serine peptidase [Lutibacter sp. A80]UMB59587.1 prolyl oligopeptidase family serine peptidase [Lutibacter sp. A80]
MQLKNYKKVSSFVLILLITTVQFAQQKTGNIVEYFGKEKVNEISEGKLLHVFKNGLSLKIQDFTFNSSSFPKEPVFDKFLMNPTLKVSENEVFDIDYLGNELKWEAISTDETNTFSNKDLKSSYVYLTYKSNSEKTVLFEASGHTMLLINGLPHEGDHYDFGWNLIPLKLKKGTNTFILKVGRFPRIRARLIEPQKPVQFTSRDLTMPDILVEETKDYKGAIRVINASNNWVENYTISSNLLGTQKESKVIAIPPMSVLKVPFSIASVSKETPLEQVDLQLELKDNKSQVISNQTVKLAIKTKHKHHKKTFISSIDGSVQYYSVAPSTDKNLEKQALFLSVHGASVEAVNQANAYEKKDWGNVIAPTNRRPFGFAWEDWGRLDALEVLADAKNIYQPDPSKIYLTGHSMGGHGTWYLGATYPDKFASIAPCAGYPDLLLYRDSFLKKTLELPQEELTKRGMTPEVVAKIKTPYIPTEVEKLMKRAGTPSRTLKLIRNYLHYGVYVLHGEKDNVVPTFIARDMRERLGKFHNDFTYYEYPDGTHWYGNHSLDWYKIFNFFKERTLKNPNEIKNLEFYTGSPGVSATSNFITIHQQKKPFEVSSFNFSKENSFKIDTDNVELLEVDLTKLSDTITNISVDGTTFNVNSNSKVFLTAKNNEWSIVNKPSLQEKGPHRNGGFKDAFRHNVVFVYATKGSTLENEWYYNKAKFDAETFWYRANGTIEVIKDTDFNPKKYTDRNIIIYGNKSNNAAWNKLLKNSPIQVEDNLVTIGTKKLTGNQWGLYFTVPRTDSDFASIGIVTATGTNGMKATYANNYLVNGTTFPDVLLFDNTVISNGDKAVKCAGFFGNDWSIDKGDFKWN